MGKKIDIAAAPTRFGTAYPPPFDAMCKDRKRWKLGDAAGMTQFGVNLMRLPPGQWTSQRHWHTAEDEFVWVVEGEVVLVTDAGEEILRAGDWAANRTATTCRTAPIPRPCCWRSAHACRARTAPTIPTSI